VESDEFFMRNGAADGGLLAQRQARNVEGGKEWLKL
jgi:hypothetical protein